MSVLVDGEDDYGKNCERDVMTSFKVLSQISLGE
jgi:hypothetical protein